MVTRVEKPAAETGRADEAFKESLAAFERQLDRRFEKMPLSRPEPLQVAADRSGRGVAEAHVVLDGARDETGLLSRPREPRGRRERADVPSGDGRGALEPGGAARRAAGRSRVNQPGAASRSTVA